MNSPLPKLLSSPHQFRVNSFMKLAGQEVPSIPQTPSEKVRELRARLILEEALETIAGLGVSILYYGVEVSWDKKGHFQFIADKTFDMVESVDGCADLSVVTIGTFSALGCLDNPFLKAVDLNNLKKFGPGSYRDASGKWIKPPDHRPPPIREILKELGWTG